MNNPVTRVQRIHPFSGVLSALLLTGLLLTPAVQAAESSDVRSKLDLAIEDEYHARSMYSAVLEQFGDIHPFSNIVLAEERHIEALANLYQQFGWEVPADPYVDAKSNFGSLAEAAQLAQEAELANAELYDGLYAGLDNADVRRVFENLQWASAERHLPSLQNYLSGNACCQGKGNGGGNGRGKGGKGKGGGRGRGGGRR